MKKYLSFILPSLLISGILLLGYRKIFLQINIWSTSFCNGDMLIIAVYLLWMVYEFKVSRNDTAQASVASDFGTREFYGFSHSITVLSALWMHTQWTNPGMYHCMGFVIFLCGAAFRIWAIQTLGQYYSHIVRRIDKHRIIETGPYRFIRHPAYAGMIIIHIGITVFFFNIVTLAALFMLLIPSIIVRILVEEKTLRGIDGYEEFSHDKKRLLPFIW